MVAEVFAGIGAFKAMFDMARALKDINDAATRNAAVIELQGQILSAQMEQAKLVEHVSTLEKQIADFEKWDAEKQKYELKQISGLGAFAYMLKLEARGTEPPHWLCTQCYENRKKSVVQIFGEMGADSIYKCPGCTAVFRARRGERPKWIDGVV